MMPFLLNFYQELLAKSNFIETKEYGKKHLIGREPFTKLMGKLIDDTMQYFQST